jgi:hypothetical protein
MFGTTSKRNSAQMAIMIASRPGANDQTCKGSLSTYQPDRLLSSRSQCCFGTTSASSHDSWPSGPRVDLTNRPDLISTSSCTAVALRNIAWYMFAVAGKSRPERVCPRTRRSPTGPEMDGPEEAGLAARVDQLRRVAEPWRAPIQVWISGLLLGWHGAVESQPSCCYPFGHRLSFARLPHTGQTTGVN